MPDDDQDGPADRDDGAPLAVSTGDPPVAFTKEGIGLAGGDGRLAEHPSQVGVAVPWTFPWEVDTGAMRLWSMVAGAQERSGVPTRWVAARRWWRATVGGCTSGSRR